MSTQDGGDGEGPDRLADAGALDKCERAWLARVGQRNALGWTIAGRNADGQLVATCVLPAGRDHPGMVRRCSATLTPAGLVHTIAHLEPGDAAETSASTRDDSPTRAYAGIGSRRTPRGVLGLIVAVARRLAVEGWTLRTGGAPGADQAFHAGVSAAGGAIELYLPWPTFQADALAALGTAAIRLDRPAPAAYEIAAGQYPNWPALSAAARHLHARNAHQILGPNLQPVDAVRFVLCWTANASTTGRQRDSGGTGQALRIAAAHGVEIFNLARPDHQRRVRSLLNRADAPQP
jgi:hypothetical protein